jgi:hypothetical protein
MKEGTLIYAYDSGRYEIAFGNGGGSCELHCGDTFELLEDGAWIPTRIEYSWDQEDWYMIGVNDDDWSIGSKVRRK